MWRKASAQLAELDERLVATPFHACQLIKATTRLAGTLSTGHPWPSITTIHPLCMPTSLFIQSLLPPQAWPPTTGPGDLETKLENVPG